MFKTYFSKAGVLFAAILAVFATSFVASSAMAQSQVILIVDQQRVLTESKVGKSIASQVKAISTSADSEVKSEITRIKAEADKFKAQQDTDAKKQAVDQQVAIQLQQIGQVGYQKIQASQTEALKKVSPNLEAALEIVYKRKKGTLMIDKSQTLFSASGLDVTNEVIAELDKKMQTVAVSKVQIFKK